MHTVSKAAIYRAVAMSVKLTAFDRIGEWRLRHRRYLDFSRAIQQSAQQAAARKLIQFLLKSC